MHPIAVLIGYFAAVLSVGSLLSYPVYLLNVALELNFGYEKVLSRSIVLTSVLLFWPVVRNLQAGMETVGLKPLRGSSLWRGGLLGAAVVVPVAIGIFALEIRVLDPRLSISFGDVVSLAAIGAVAGLAVGFIEEVIFRGLIFSLLRNRIHAVSAAVATSVLYALVHFLKVGEDFVVADPGWLTGLDYLSRGFSTLARPAEYWDSFVSLFLLGLALTWVRVRGNLYWCVGIHAGFVMVIQVVKALSVRSVVNPYMDLVGSYDHFTGHLVSIWLVILAIAVAVWLGRRRRATTVAAG